MFNAALITHLKKKNNELYSLNLPYTININYCTILKTKRILIQKDRRTNNIISKHKISAQRMPYMRLVLA